MKKITLLTICAFFSVAVPAQAPQGITHQAVIRDAANNLVTNSPIGIRVSIIQGTPDGLATYSETHLPTSNANGLITFVIGQGTTDDDFSDIDWSAGPYFIKTEADPLGGSNYSIIGTSQVFSVPYALYAENSGNGAWVKNGDDIFYEDGKVGVGTNAPQTGLHLNNGDLRITNGQIDFGDQHRIINYSSADVMSVQSPGPVAVVIDNNNNNTNASFTVRKDNKNPALATEIFRVQENGTVGIGTSTPHASAVLDASSTSKGFLPPRMNSTQIANIENPANGLTVFNTFDRHLYVFNTVDYKWKRVAYDAVTITTVCGSDFIDWRDNEIYQTVLIGSKCWMKDNLKYLPSVVGPGTGSNTTPYYYVYGYNGTSVSSAEATANYQNYGVLFNWPAAVNACPTGWHLPSDDEWEQLVTYVASQGFPNQPDAINGAGNALKSCRQVNSPLGGGCNTSEHPRWNSHGTHHGFDQFGFSALPGGYRHTIGSFHHIGGNGLWWSSTEHSSSNAWSRYMDYSLGYMSRSGSSQSNGFSVRCLRDID